MSILEQLRPFVSLCQACGFIPYTMKYDSTNKIFIRFAFSVRNFTTWWFLLLILFEITIPILTSNVTKDISTQIENYKDLPSTFFMAFIVFLASNFMQFLIARWIVLFRYRQLGNVVRAVEEIENLLLDDNSLRLPNFIHKHFVIGFIITIVLVAMTFISMIPVMMIFYKNVGILLLLSLFSVQIILAIMFYCTLMMFHFCYRIMAYCIQLLRTSFRSDAERKTSEKTFSLTFHRTKTNYLEIMRRTGKLFDLLCKMSSELNSIFSGPVLLIVTTYFLMITISAFVFMLSLINNNNQFITAATWVMSITFINCWIIVVMLLLAAEQPIFQTRLFREDVFKIAHSFESEELSEKTAVMSLLMRIDENRICLTACGLFKVGIHLIPPLMGAVVTYLIVLLES